MNHRAISLALAAALAAAPLSIGAAKADVTDPDSAYCPLGQVTGSVQYTLPVPAAPPIPDSLTMNINATCTVGPDGNPATGDEAGSYSLTLQGSGLAETCAGGTSDVGKGNVSGNGPEGSLQGSFNYTKIGIHYYITGTYQSASEPHSLQLWVDDIAGPSNPAPPPCPYSQAPLYGHGAFIDTPVDQDTFTFTGTGHFNPPVQLLNSAGQYTFLSTTCEYTSSIDDEDPTSEFGSCNITTAGNYVSSVCGTGVGNSVDQTGLLTSGDGSDSNVEYTATVVVGNGVVTGSLTEPDGDGATFSGDFQIYPTAGNCVTGITDFGVVGQFTVTG